MTELNRDFYKDKASKMFGVPYEEVTEEQRSDAKKQLMDYMYCRTDNYSFKDCQITAKLLEPKDSDNSLKNLHEKLRRNSGVEKYSAIQKMIEQGNVTSLKDLHRRFISDCENNGYKITELQDEVTIENSGEPLTRPYSSQFDYKGMWLKHYQRAYIDEIDKE